MFDVMGFIFRNSRTNVPSGGIRKLWKYQRCLFFLLRTTLLLNTVHDNKCQKAKDPSDYAVIRAYCLLRLIAFPIIVRIDWRAHKR